MTLSIWQEKKSCVRGQEECNGGPGTYNTLLAHNINILLILAKCDIFNIGKMWYLMTKGVE